ncbi:MAG: amidohydrolase family protein [Desulforhopalus sp.]|nr:amidohydrolase family protein [Desulforhopalus sp.]
MADTAFLRVGWLIDGSGGPIQENVLIAIKDSRLAAIEPYAPGNGIDPAQITDLSRCTILPPLVDSHLHLFMSGTTDPATREHQLIAGYDELQPVISRHLQDLFNHGVLAIRDGGDRGGFALAYRQTKAMHPQMIVKTTGQAWHATGRYGRLIGRCPGDGESLAEAFVRDEDKADQVKVVNSGLNSLKEFGRETKPQFSLADLAGIVEAAAKLGRKIMVHANGREPVRLAVEAGCHSIEHGFFMGRENLERMADKGTFWVPTVFTMKAYALNQFDPMLADRKVVEKNLEHQLGQLTLARQLGVNLALGTDAGSLGVLHGESIIEEMKCFLKAGFSLAETVRCATSNGARLLGLDDFGLLTKGKPATFLIARGGPSLLPRKLSYLEGIYYQGAPSTMYRKNPVKHVAARD